MNRLVNKIAVVSGSALGIGRAIARQLLDAKAIVIGLDTNVESMHSFKSSLPPNLSQNFCAIKCDVKNLNEVESCFAEISKNHGNTDILVNSAGVLRHGNLLEMPLSGVRETFETHLLGTIHCTKEAFKRDIKESNGHIIFINSITGHRIPAFMGKSIPTTNMYTPSKYALTAMVEVLRQELLNMDSNVRVTSISPGLTETPIVPEFLLQNPNINKLQPEDVADCVMFALNTPPHVQVHELIVLPLRGIL